MIAHTSGTIIGMNTWCFPLSLLLSSPVVSDSLRPHGLQHTRTPCPSPSLSLPKFKFIALMRSRHLILWRPPLLLPLIFPSIRGFSMSLLCASDDRRGCSISPSSEYSGLISLKIDWFDLLAVQATFKSLFQHHTSKASILWRSAFFTVQLSQPYVTSEKTIVLTMWTFVGRVRSLLFNALSRFVIPFLPRGCRLLISWLQSRPAVILEPKRRKPVTPSTFSPSICHAVMGPDATLLVF